MNNKRVFSWILGVFILLHCSVLQAQKPSVIIDADTGNEVDDLFAVSRALIAPEIEIVGLNSTQWQNSHWAV